MKCSKCNEKEATFHYEVNLNGKKSETHLCADCARAEGYGDMLDYRPAPLFSDWFLPSYSPFGGFFDEFFAPRRSLFPSFARLMAPAMALPRVSILIGEEPKKTEEAAETAEAQAPAQEVPPTEPVQEVSEEEMLRAQLAEAVKAEDFEKAIELRDRLRALAG